VVEEEEEEERRRRNSSSSSSSSRAEKKVHHITCSFLSLKSIAMSIAWYPTGLEADYIRYAYKGSVLSMYSN
jgi:hypothetical protein